MTRAALLAVVLASSAAHAQGTNEDQAKAHFTVGKGYQDLGQFAKAAEEFKLAYELDPRPEMLFNIAQAYRLADDKKQALEYFQKYVAAQPDGSGAAEAKQHIDELSKQLADEAARAAPTPAPPAPEPQPQPPPPTPEPAPEAHGTSTLRIAGFVALGAGAIGVGLGVKFGLDARSDASSLSSNTTAWTVADHARYDEGRSANRNMYISYAAGGALVVTGALLVWLGRDDVTATVDSRSASVALRGTF